MSESADLETLDRQSLLHPFTSIEDHLAGGPLIMREADGIRVRDNHGRSYIDAMAGLWCVNVGYGRTELVDAMTEQARRMPYYHSFSSMSNEPAIELAHRLLGLVPGSMSKVFFANSGSEANDTQVKIVRYYNNARGLSDKKKILSRRGAYHGVTLGATSMSGLAPMHAVFDLPLEGFLHLGMPHHYRYADAGMSEEDFSAALATELEQLIATEGAHTIAAMIAEPVLGAGGVIVPPRGYFERIVPVLREHDILLIVDEVICGFGRLGAAFGSHVFGLEPDLMTIAKGLTSGYVPMSACVVSDKVWDVLRADSHDRGPFSHGYTYSAHPIAAAVALANLDVLEGERLFDNAATVGRHFQHRLRQSVGDHPLVGEVRGLGLVAGVELVANRASRASFAPEIGAGRRLAAILLDSGLISRAIRDTMTFSPPLVLGEADADEIVAILTRGLERLAGQLESEGVWSADQA